jgi:hypothetical protein
MRTVLPSVGGVLLAVALTAGPIQAQEKDGTHRLVIYNGSTRTVHYFGPDAAAARARTRQENEATIADLVLALRLQYLANEQVFEARRHQVQMLLYGFSTTYPTNPYGGGNWGGYWGGYWGSWWPYSYSSVALGSATWSLANGVGDEGDLKRELIRGLGTPLAPPGVGALPPPKPKE